MALGWDVAITWLGHSTFLVRSPSGKTLLVDPWLSENPSCPPEHRQPRDVDALLVTSGDHLRDVVRIARESKVEVVANPETARWLARRSVARTRILNLGGTCDLLGFKVTMVHADHSSSIVDDDGSVATAGESCGYVITFGNGKKVYCSGETNVFGDMRLIGELYKPDVAILPIGGVQTMGPREAAFAVKLLGVRRVIPMCFGTDPEATPKELRSHLDEVGLSRVQLIELAPGQTLT
jgi:L-ascorbate metabolism protein UlaG (beta-lactamase superfamily)